MDRSREEQLRATRAVYDASAERYVEAVGTEISAATEGPLDRAVLDAFLALIGTDPAAPVADVGCGPGRVASLLTSRGVTALGIDASSAMINEARRAHPDIELVVGALDALPLRADSLSAVICWYSIIHTPERALCDAFAELGRVLQPRGQVLLAFQSGGVEPVHRTDAHGSGRPLTSYGLDTVTRALEQCGFDVHASAERPPSLSHETARQAFVIARTTPDAAPQLAGDATS